jgi:hypothetical protein
MSLENWLLELRVKAAAQLNKATYPALLASKGMMLVEGHTAGDTVPVGLLCRCVSSTAAGEPDPELQDTGSSSSSSSNCPCLTRTARGAASTRLLLVD